MQKNAIRLCLLLIATLTPALVNATSVAVTLPPLAGIVAMLDEKTETICLLPAAADPHHFQLQPRKIEALKQADILIRASFDDGGWPLPPVHHNSIDLWPDRDHGWLSPAEVRKVLPSIASALIALQPERKEKIEHNLKTAVEATIQLENKWRSTLQPFHSSGVIMQHPAWRRLMIEMGTPVLAVLESGHHGHEHGPHALDGALQKLNSHPGALLLHDAAHINKALEWIAAHAETPVRQATLNALGSCNSSWAAFMQANLDALKTATQP